MAKSFKLQVKDQSVHAFMKKHSVGLDEIHPNQTAHSLLRDKLYFKKGTEIVEGDEIQIQLADRGANSQKELTNYYVYRAEKYDDISLEMKLVHFEVSLKV